MGILDVGGKITAYVSSGGPTPERAARELRTTRWDYHPIRVEVESETSVGGSSARGGDEDNSSSVCM